jgi:hypothetical protein
MPQPEHRQVREYISCGGEYLRRSMQEVETMTVYQMHADARRAKQGLTAPEVPGEQQQVALGILRRMLVEFHREWTELRSREDEAGWVLTANALLDHYAHRIYDIICDLEGCVDEDLATDIRCLSADMIMTANILVMTCYGEECCRRGDALAEAALCRAERCRTLQKAVR